MTMITRLRDWLGQPQGPLTQADADASRQGTDAPTTPGAMRLTPALDGELIWSDSVPDAAPLRAVEVEALVWSTITIPPWITVIVVLFSVALAALLGSAWLAV